MASRSADIPVQQLQDAKRGTNLQPTTHVAADRNVRAPASPSPSLTGFIFLVEFGRIDASDCRVTKVARCKVTRSGFEELNIKIKIFGFIRLYQA